MKISFMATFRNMKMGSYIDDDELMDALLIFLPSKVSVTTKILKVGYQSKKFQTVKLETGELLTLEDIKDKLWKKNKIEVTNVRSVSAEYNKMELKQIKKKVCLKAILEPTEEVRK